MPITRDQATRVLTQAEMGLFGDSRNPALRALSEKALSSRVVRTRKLRDKSHDMLQRQKLKSRERTGSKLGTSGNANQRTAKKGEILEDMLQRFETRLQDVRAAADAGTSKPNTSRASSKKTITPKRALANTRALLEAKKKRDRQPPAYLAIDTHAGSEATNPGFQSGTAKSRSLDMHESEMRMEPIHGSVSTKNRVNQGERDNG